MTFKDRQLNSITFQALKMKFLNSMTRTNFVALIKYKFILLFCVWDTNLRGEKETRVRWVSLKGVDQMLTLCSLWYCPVDTKNFVTLPRKIIRSSKTPVNCFGQLSLRACLHGGRGVQVGEVTHLGGVTNLIRSRLHDRWDDTPHVTSPIWGPPPPCKTGPKAGTVKTGSKWA